MRWPQQVLQRELQRFRSRFDCVTFIFASFLALLGNVSQNCFRCDDKIPSHLFSRDRCTRIMPSLMVPMEKGSSASWVPPNLPQQQQQAGRQPCVSGDKFHQLRHSSHYFYLCDVLVSENNLAWNFPGKLGDHSGSTGNVPRALCILGGASILGFLMRRNSCYKCLVANKQSMTS